MKSADFRSIIPAKAGISCGTRDMSCGTRDMGVPRPWIPAFAGMTEMGCVA
jgi:hypothetical protein